MIIFVTRAISEEVRMSLVHTRLLRLTSHLEDKPDEGREPLKWPSMFVLAWRKHETIAIVAGIRLNEAACRCRYTQLACRKPEILWGTISEACIHLDHLTSLSSH